MSEISHGVHTLFNLWRVVSVSYCIRYAEAEHQASLLVIQFPDFGFIWKVLGAALKAQGKNALPALQKAVELLPDDPEVHSNLGFAQTDLKQFDEAIASCRRALALDPAFPIAHNNLGNVLKKSARANRRCCCKLPSGTDTVAWFC